MGGMACLAQDLNKESKRIARYRARMESVDKWMSRRHLPKSLRSRIGHHYQEVRPEPGILLKPVKCLLRWGPCHALRPAFPERVGPCEGHGYEGTKDLQPSMRRKDAFCRTGDSLKLQVTAVSSQCMQVPSTGLCAHAGEAC